MSTKVQWYPPLTRLKPFYPGVMGLAGTDSQLGLRHDVNGIILYVDPNATNANNNNDGTDPEHPLATVANALTKCRSYRNDTIVVMGNGAWQYGPGTPRATEIAESVEITVHGVRLVGLFPTSSVGVVWETQDIATPAITVSAIDVVIEGFAFVGTNDGTAIYCEWDGVTLFGENLTVRNCLFDEDIDVAIQLEYSWYCDIHDCVFDRCDTYGIYVDVGGSGIAYSMIHDNIFNDCGIAISLLGGCDNNYVYHNQILNSTAQGAGAAANEGINTTGGDDNMVCDNYFSCLLPVPANGDWDDLNTAAATDAWIGNHCMNGLAITNPT